ncbi:MAG: MFS transporter [Planctomycetes bacterium]|nr:MFS transporter [Planctomycetota bacterium]
MQPTAAPRPAPPAGYRWLVLLACSIAMFGNYYAFDALYPVTDALQKELGFSGAEIGLLDTAYNVAALLTLIAGGVLIDRLGTARAVLLFAGIGALGTLGIAVLPALLPGAPALAMACGRFVLGVGAELFIVAGTTVVGRWFKAKEISFALALQLLIARLGSYAADVSPSVAPGLFESWQPPLLVAAAFGLGWFAFAALYAGLEGRAMRRYGVVQAAADKLVLADLVRFPKSYWLVVGICVAFYATIFPFRTFANLYLIEAHGESPARAGDLKSWLPLFSMIGMPLFGLLADRIGRRVSMMLLGSALLVPPFLLMGYTRLPLEASMALLGIAFALVPAVLWPAVTYLVAESRLGSAYAMMTFCQQVGWMGMSAGLGVAKDVAGASASNPGGWQPFLWLLTGLSSLGLVCAVLLWLTERGPHGHGLDRRKPNAAGG